MAFAVAANPYLPAYVPAYVDWRHTAGRSAEPKHDLDDLPNALLKKIDKKMQKQAVRAHAERMKYVKNFKKFRDKVEEEMEGEDLRRPGVELVGKEMEPKKDLIYVTYVIDEESLEQMEAIQKFIIDAFHEYGLGQHFREEPEGAIPKKDQVDDEENVHEEGDVVVWVWPRRDHEYPEFERTPIDYWNPSDDDEGGGF